MPKTKVEYYKGSPIIVLNPDARFPFQFGLAKAKLILENLDAIREFVTRFDAPKAGGGRPSQQGQVDYAAAERRSADRVDGYDRDDLGHSADC